MRPLSQCIEVEIQKLTESRTSCFLTNLHHIWQAGCLSSYYGRYGVYFFHTNWYYVLALLRAESICPHRNGPCLVHELSNEIILLVHIRFSSVHASATQCTAT